MLNSNFLLLKGFLYYLGGVLWYSWKRIIFWLINIIEDLKSFAPPPPSLQLEFISVNQYPLRKESQLPLFETLCNIEMDYLFEDNIYFISIKWILELSCYHTFILNFQDSYWKSSGSSSQIIAIIHGYGYV